MSHLERAHAALAELSLEQRRDLARFLDASDAARADVVRQCFEHGYGALGELLIDLEEDRSAAGLVRLAIEALEPMDV